MGRKVPLRCSVRIHRKLLRPFSDSLSSTTSLDRCSALESRLIRRKWSRILRLFESESDKIGAQRPAFAFQEPLYAGFSAGSPVLNEVVLGTLG